MGKVREIFRQRWPEIVISILVVFIAILMFGRAVAGVLFLAVAVIWLGAVLFQRESGPKQGVEGFAALLSILALMLGGYWYFIERKGYPKLNLEPAVQAWPVENRGLLVWSSVKLSNVGNLALNFGANDKILVQVGQVFPLTGKHGTQLLRDMVMKRERGEKRFTLAKTDSWPSRATFEDAIGSVIEAGESENLYFKTIIPCEDNAILAVTVTIPKENRLVGNQLRSAEQVAWIGQAVHQTQATCKD